MTQFRKWLLIGLAALTINEVLLWIEKHAIKLMVVFGVIAFLAVATCSLQQGEHRNESSTEASSYTRHAG